MASPGLSEILTTTLEHRSKKLADNVTVNHALLNRLNSKSNIQLTPGGASILQELEYAENSTYTRYSGYELLNISPSDVFTAAEFDWKQAAVAVSISGLEQLKNSGPDQMIPLLTSRVKNAEKTMRNNISADIYSAGTASGGKQIGGLQLLVADDPTTGIVGGINRANWAFWKNKISDIGGSSFTSTNIQGHMNALYIQLVRGNDKPDLIVADNTTYIKYLESLQTIQRITSDSMASAGFTSLKFMNSDVVLDGGYGGDAPSNHMYFLNTDYIHWRPHRDRNMVPLDPDRFSTNQDAVVKLIGFAGNMTISNCFLQGVLFT